MADIYELTLFTVTPSDDGKEVEVVFQLAGGHEDFNFRISLPREGTLDQAVVKACSLLKSQFSYLQENIDQIKQRFS